MKIDVTFEINTDGIVNVSACDRETGQQTSTAITLSSGLSAEEMAKILAARRTERVKPEKPAPVAAPVKPAPAPAPKAKAAAAAPAKPAPAPRPAPPPPAPVLAPANDDLDVLPDDDDLEAVLDEVGVEPPPPPPPKPAAARAPAPPPQAAPAPPKPAPFAARAPAPAPQDDPLIEIATDDLGGDLDGLDLGGADLGADLGSGDVVGPLDVQDASEPATEISEPPQEFDALPSSENEVELDSGDLETMDLDLGAAGEFSHGVDGGPMIGGRDEFSEGDFGGAPAAAEEDPNAKTQPDQNGATRVAAKPPPAPAAAPAPAGAEGDDLFGEAGVDLSSLGDDDAGSR